MADINIVEYMKNYKTLYPSSYMKTYKMLYHYYKDEFDMSEIIDDLELMKFDEMVDEEEPIDEEEPMVFMMGLVEDDIDEKKDEEL